MKQIMIVYAKVLFSRTTNRRNCCEFHPTVIVPIRIINARSGQSKFARQLIDDAFFHVPI